MRTIPFALLAVAISGCGSNSTGSAIVSFQAAAAGPADAVAGQPLVFSGFKPSGATAPYEVTLTRARLHVGALYLNRSVPISGSQNTPCILPGIYSGEVTVPLDVDLLSPIPQPFPAPGEGTADQAFTGEVWLFGSDVNATADATVLVDVAGTAVLAGTSYPFTGRLTISANRAAPVTNPALPGAHPLCKTRIITPIPVDITLASGGSLLLRADPRVWFQNIDFAQVPLANDPANPTLRAFGDSSTAQPDLYGNGVFNAGAYVFSWQGP
jgi:hypothetical protein